MQDTIVYKDLEEDLAQIFTSVTAWDKTKGNHARCFNNPTTFGIAFHKMSSDTFKTVQVRVTPQIRCYRYSSERVLGQIIFSDAKLELV